MKVLIAKEKHGERVFDVSTQEKKDKAVLTLFNERRSSGYYKDLQDMKSVYYDKAVKGDAKAAFTILLKRIDYEYENIHIVDAE